MIYSGGCPARAGRMRRLPFSAKKLESAVLRFPVARGRLKTCKKESFNSCGEATNFQPTFSGVAFRKAKELPLISLEEKKKVFGGSAVPAPDDYQESHHDDQPLFWQESKPIALWLALLDELRIQSVFDVSAGSGALMPWLVHQQRAHGLGPGHFGQGCMWPDFGPRQHHVFRGACQSSEGAVP